MKVDPMERRPLALRYAVAVGLVLTATAIRFPLQRFLGHDVPFLLYFPAVLAGAWYGGFGPGVLAGVLSALLANFLWMAPHSGFTPLSGAIALQLSLFLAICVLMSWIIQRLHASIVRLRQARNRIEQNLRTMSDGFAILDREWRYVYVNERGAQMARQPAAELLGRKLWDLFPDQVGGMSYNELQRCMAQKVPVHYETFYEGFGRWFEVRAYPAEEGLAMYVADITEKKNIELAVRGELESQVAAKTTELAERNRDLEALTHTLAHDLRAPLRAINGLTSILSEDYAERFDEAGKGLCDKIVAAGQRAERMLVNLLEYARLSHAALPQENVNIETVVGRVMEQLRQEIQQAGAKVEVQRPLPTVLANETIVEQAIANFLSNALKFRREDAEPMVSIGAEPLDGEVVISVRDNGIGIAAKDVPKLFTPFERITAQRPGTGLGLSIVKKAIERMGGHVGVESQPGKGSRFWFSLPAAAAAPH